MKPRINIITLGVQDLQHAIEFYEQGLNLPRKPFDGNVAFFELNGTWLALYPWKALAEDAEVTQEGKGFRGVTLAHVVRSREEVDEVLRQAENAGARIIKPAQDVFWAGIPAISPIRMGTCGKCLESALLARPHR